MYCKHENDNRKTEKDPELYTDSVVCRSKSKETTTRRVNINRSGTKDEDLRCDDLSVVSKPCSVEGLRK